MAPVRVESTMSTPTQDAREKNNPESGLVDNGFGSNSLSRHDSSSIKSETQHGVLKVEAIATVWSTKSLITACVLIWITYFIILLESAGAVALTPYVTSAFQYHSLTPTVGVISSIIAGGSSLTMAKILDVCGRPQGYAVSLGLLTVGLITMAATDSVEMYAAAQVFWTVGNSSVGYVLGIVVADTTKLKSRGLMLALTTTPNLATVWLGGPISEAFLLKEPGWKWFFGAFSIIVPVTSLPLFILLMINSAKARKKSILSATTGERRSVVQSLKYYAQEFDAVGLLLLTAGLSILLLPFNLYSFQSKGWQSPLIISMLVLGIFLMILFVLWERFMAPITFIPFSLLLDRDMVGACIMGMVMFISFCCWNSFFSSFLQVVNGLSYTHASYVTQIYGIGSSLFTIVTGAVIKYTGRFKPITLYGAIPTYALSMGLMIYFRQPEMNIGYTVMCQIFLSFAAGVMLITPTIAAQSGASHQHVAVVVAIVSMFSSIGGAVGLVVAGAIWQSIFPQKLALYLPQEEMVHFHSIYGMLDVQLSYPIGSPARAAIQRAYGDAQAMMLTCGTVIWVVGAASVACWRNTDVRNIKQVKGHVI